ncbi:agamous-like MADS-box protein AGL80 [Rutidosis leptorrhynchoides]|uniref:agamous-like MADS-box protein AGL80 n=1 Tax=Rutidosis leptorrhynchoides TaxID=125765 RepID=UPI003A9A2813
MTRKKVEIKLIEDESKRKTTFKKRKKGLMKKVNELSTLCGVDACALIYSPYEPHPDVWPDNVGVQRVLSQFKRLPDMEKSKKMVNQNSFIRQRINKANDQLKKQIKENRDKEMIEVMYQCLTRKGSIANLNPPDLNELGGLVDQTMKDIDNRIESLKKGPVPTGNAAPPSLCARSKLSVGGSSSSTSYDNLSVMDGMQRSTQWFTDLMNNNPSEQNLCLGPRGYEMTASFAQNRNLGLVPPGYEMTTPFIDNPNPLWPNPYFS